MSELYGLDPETATYASLLEYRNEPEYSVEEGAWSHEPDFVQWYEDGYYLKVRRNHFLNWCGYIAVDITHPWYDNLDAHHVEVDALVHGGVTFLGFITDIDDVPVGNGYGFDCAHANDFTPVMHASTREIFRNLNKNMRGMYRDQLHYWTLSQVIAETRRFIRVAKLAKERADAALSIDNEWKDPWS